MNIISLNAEPKTLTPLQKEIEEYRFRMKMAKRDGHPFAYKDAKKKYDKLLKEEKRHERANV